MVIERGIPLTRHLRRTTSFRPSGAVLAGQPAPAPTEREEPLPPPGRRRAPATPKAPSR
jgi:hypothetical protein